MKIDIIGKNVAVSDAMRAKIEQKLGFLEKYFLIDADTSARVVVGVFPNTQKIEITIPTKVAILRTEVEDPDLYSAIDLAIDKLEDQIRRQKTRLSRKHKEKLAVSFIEEELLEELKKEKDDILVRTKVVQAEHMDLEEAIMRMEMLGHDFFIFTDNETDKISVVYRRKNGGYGCIETE